jgi:pyruvate dehydrogenase E2 component (dihydrolipoamide acetyltransferase)
MATPIQMPQPGNTVEECILVKWTISKGGKVSSGDIVAEIETDKANFDIESPVDGVLLETFFEEGSLVAVLTNICVIGAPGEDVEPFRPKAPAPVETKAPPAPPPAASAPSPAAGVPEQPQPVAAPVPTPVAAPAAVGVLSPRARKFAEEHDFFPASVPGSGPGGRVLEADIRELYESSPRVSSLARQMIKDGYRPRGNGSGVSGMLLAQDLLEPPVRMSRMRETIARRMRESLTVTAQYTMHASADATGLLELRKKIKAAGNGGNANINDMVMFCTAKTLVEVPEINAELINNEIYRHSEINLGFACDTDRGLVVPVVKGCRNLPLAELAIRIHQLSDEAVNGTLSPDDMMGGTFTVSNLGGLGVEAFTPIVNPPQVAILGVDTIQLKPVRRDGEVVFVDHIGFSITCDHQVIDGAPGARFLQKLKQNIENVEALAGL